MKAVVLKDGFQMGFAEIPVPSKLGPDEALVKVVAAALNRRDYWISRGLYPGIKFGKVMGGDGSGVVVEVGSSAHSAWKGSEVVINSVHNWGPDENVSAPGTVLLGVPLDGTLAHYVKVPVSRLYRKPSHLSFEQAAAIPIAGITAYRALIKSGEFKPGNSVLVTGIGSGVAPFAVQFARALGSTVWVTSGQQWKIDKAKSDLGVTGGVNYKTETWDKELLEKAGMFDIIIDGAAGPGLEKLVRLLKPGGRLVSYGGTTLKKPTIDIFRIFLWGQKIVGSSLGSDKDWNDMMRLIEAKKVVPVVDSVRPFEKVIEAIQAMEDTASKQFGKIVIKVAPQNAKL